MADSDNTLKILIQLGVIGKDDVAALKDLMGEVGQSGKDAAASMSGSMPENLAAWDKYSKRLQETGGSAEELRHGLHSLDKAARIGGMTEFAHLAHAAMNPVLLTVTAIVGGMEAYFKWQEKVEERNKAWVDDLQKVNEAQRKMIADGPSVQASWLEVARTVAAARAEIHGLGAQLKEFENTAKVFDAELMEGLNRRIAGRDQELTLLQEQAKLMEAIGAMSPDKAAEVQAQAEHQKKVDSLKAEISKKAAEVSSATLNYNTEQTKAGGTNAFSPEAIGAAQKKVQDAEEAVRRAERLVVDSPDQIKALQKQIRAQQQRGKDHPLEWNDAVNAQIELRDRIKLLQQQAANSSTALPSLVQNSATAKADFESVKGLRDKFEGMEQAIRLLNQSLIDAKTALPGKLREENSKFASESAIAMLQRNNLTPNAVLTQGTAAADEIRGLARNGYTADKIKREGELAQNSKAGKQPFDQGALDRLAALNRDQAAVSHLNILLNSMGTNQSAMIAILNNHMAYATSTTAAITALQNAWAVISRQTAAMTANGR